MQAVPGLVEPAAGDVRLHESAVSKGDAEVYRRVTADALEPRFQLIERSLT